MKKIKVYTEKKFLRSVVCLTAACLLLCASCTGDFDEINTNRDAPTSATASTLATSMLGNIMRYNLSDLRSVTRFFMEDYFLVKMAVFSRELCAVQYNKFDENYFMYDFGKRSDYVNLGFGSLRNAEKMVALTDDKTYDTYKGFALFLKAYQLYYISCFYGDIPYGEAVQGETLTLTPKYDTQKEVMAQILDDLDLAYEHFSKATAPLGGDFVFDGNLENWKKVVSAFELNVLITLSRKESEPELRVKERFARIVESRPLFTSNADNLALTFADQGGMYYALNEMRGNFYMFMWLSDYFVSMLKRYEDCRLFSYGKPAQALLDENEGLTADSFDAYVGIDHTLPFNEVQTLGDQGRGSNLNDRYIFHRTGEPHAKLGYAQMNFVLAEGALRGWIPGSPSDYYKKGIEAGLTFTMQHTPGQYANGRPITADYIREHLEKPALQLTGSFEADLEKIMEQKYIASFLQYQRDTYLDYRRTGYPRLPINPSTSLNLAPERMQVRIKYPSGELSYNRANLEEAVQRQFNGFDDENQLMWLLK
ncbi:MAG: SusD/RagB family nutrient-binding outer membrane lipoprotein [Tannerella sp.]|nr:SusD/RagB family nutrient-binding outer membrane lipoprotein [Tannerella sp.]